MFGLDRGAKQKVAQTTTRQGRPQGTVLRLYRQVTQADTLSVSLGAIRKNDTSSRCCVLL